MGKHLFPYLTCSLKPGHSWSSGCWCQATHCSALGVTLRDVASSLQMGVAGAKRLPSPWKMNETHPCMLLWGVKSVSICYQNRPNSEEILVHLDTKVLFPKKIPMFSGYTAQPGELKKCAECHWESRSVKEREASVCLSLQNPQKRNYQAWSNIPAKPALERERQAYCWGLWVRQHRVLGEFQAGEIFSRKSK